MKKVIQFLAVLGLMVLTLQAGAQFTGGNGRGDYMDPALAGPLESTDVVYFGGIGRGDIASLVYSGYMCVNPTDGGTIALDQTICYGADPVALTSTTLPTGHNGGLEYQWQFSTEGGSSGFTDIGGATSTVYDAPSVTQTTWYKRLARGACMTDWTGAAESDVMKVTVNPLPTFTFLNSDVLCSGGSDGTITINASGGSGSGYEYRIYNGSTWTGWQTNPLFVNLPSGLYTIEVKDSNGCVQNDCP